MNRIDSISQQIRELKLSPGVVTFNDHISLRTLSPHSSKEQFSRDIADTTVWRNIYPDAYMTVFYSTWERTYQWLSKKYGNDDTDIMLMATDSHGISFGHFSFISFADDNGVLKCELSRVARGPGLGPQNGINQSIRMGLNWCTQELGIQTFNLRVFSDNERAARLYAELGFRETKKINLKKQLNEEGYEWKYTESNQAERSETLMTLETNKD